MWHCATIAGGRESRTVQESRDVEVGESDQWRQTAVGVDGEYTRLQGHQATGVLQTVRGEAGSITVERYAEGACRDGGGG